MSDLGGDMLNASSSPSLSSVVATPLTDEGFDPDLNGRAVGAAVVTGG